MYKLPLRNAIPVPGGGINEAMRAINALHEDSLNAKKKELENKYYEPKMQAEIENKNLINQYYGPQKAAELKHQNLVNQYYGPTAQSDLETAALTREKTRQGIDNPFINSPLGQLMWLKNHPEANGAPAGNPMADRGPPIPTSSPENSPNGLNNIISVLTGPNGKDLKNQLNNSVPMGAPNGKTPELAPPNDLYNLAKRDYEASLANKELLAKNRIVGGRGDANVQNQAQLISNLGIENPQLPKEDLPEAAGNVLQGKNTLNDGRPINIGGLTQSALDQIALHTTTAKLTTQKILANQAEAELRVFSEKASKWIKPYATTYFGRSPQALIDSFKNDDESQEKLGQLVAANTIQNEIAQQRTRQANGQPGITQTHELMNEAQQHINANFPRLSAKAREVANNKINEALSEGLEARNKVSINASSARNKPSDDSSGDLTYNLATKSFEDEPSKENNKSGDLTYNREARSLE